MRWLFLIAGVALCPLVLAGSDAPPPDLGWTGKLAKDADRARIEVHGKTAMIDVTSSTGIGKLTLAAAENRQLPARLTIRLKYAHLKKFDTLEGLTLTTPHWQVRGNSKQSGRLPFFLPDEKGVFEADDTQPAGWFDIQVKPVDEELEIKLPARLLLPERRLELEWIDFYRN